MKKSRKRTTAIGLIGLIAVLIIALGAVAVFAQDDTTPEEPAFPAMPFGRGGFHGGHHGGFHGRSFGSAGDEDLAEALGITVEELQAARQKMAADRLAQAVEDGILTQDQHRKYHLVRAAARVQPLIPAFRLFALIPPR